MKAKGNKGEASAVSFPMVYAPTGGAIMGTFVPDGVWAAGSSPKGNDLRFLRSWEAADELKNT